MSITKLRGCFSTVGPPVAILIGVLLVVGMLYVGGGDRGQSPGEQARLGDVAFVLNGEPVYTGELTEEVNQARQSMLTQRTQANEDPDLSPTESLSLRLQAISAAVSRAVIIGKARREGVDFGDHSLRAWMDQRLEEALRERRQQASMMYDWQVSILDQQVQQALEEHGEDSQEAREAQQALQKHRQLSVDEYAAQVEGVPLAEAMQFQREFLERTLEDPVGRRAIEAEHARAAVLQTYMDQVDVSDEALRRSYDQISYQQLLVTHEKTDEPMGRAREIRRRIDEGMSFEDAQRQFSEMRDEAGLPRIQTDTQTRMDILSMPFSQILELQPGEVSQPIQLQAGAAIYKIMAVEPSVPDDFEQQKQDRARNLRLQVGSANLTMAIEQELEAARPSAEFRDQGWKLLWDYVEIVAGPTAERLSGPENREARIDALRNLLDSAQGVASADFELGALVRYAAFNQIDTETPAGQEKEGLRAERIDLYAQLEDVLGSSTAFRREYARLLIEAGEGDRALEQLSHLLKAAYPPAEQRRPLVDEVDALLPRAANVATPGTALVAEIQEEIRAWRNEEAEMRAEREALQREEQERLRRETEELERQEGRQTPPQTGQGN